MERILIVDDAMFMRKIIKGILKDGGYTDIMEAEDGESAIVLYREKSPDVVILDITMPNMDGIETLRQIKGLNPTAKVIICSAIGQEKLMMRAISLGAAEYIVKPFKPDTMLCVIKKVIG